MISNGKLKSIFEAHHRDIYALTFSYLHNREEAEEITQETFLKLLRRDHLPVCDAEMKRWLFKVAVNRCLDRFRSLKIIEKWIRQMTSWRGTEKTAHQGAVVQEIKQALSLLDGKSRMVVLLKYYEDMTYSEIAEIMGIPEGTVKSLLSRAIQKIEVSNSEVLCAMKK